MRLLRQFEAFYYFFTKKFYTHQKAPKSTKKAQKAPESTKSIKHNQTKA